ncbi:hypothetical protein L0337_17495 [candidate division KSB1 bacterium]|nr:hypothetical protein [candidate division KSB1 bacterium]
MGQLDEVKRSTLADANEKRHANIYRTYFFELLKQCRSFNLRMLLAGKNLGLQLGCKGKISLDRSFGSGSGV